MAFAINEKVALITGGAGEIGLECAKALLRNGLRGVSLVDIDTSLGERALQQICNQFGPDRALFLKTDVSKLDQLEDAFKETIKKFGNLDIVFNNAGILDDARWEKEISINLNGVIHGVMLGLEKYLPLYKQGPEALIVNTSSIVGVIGSAHVPIYSATKHAIIGLTRSWGDHSFYEKFKVRMVAVCPGVTDTPIINERRGGTFGNEIYKENLEKFKGTCPVQTLLARGVKPTNRCPRIKPGGFHVFGVAESEYTTHFALIVGHQLPQALAEKVLKVVKHAPHGTIWIAEEGDSPYQYICPDRSEMKHNKLSEL